MKIKKLLKSKKPWKSKDSKNEKAVKIWKPRKIKFKCCKYCLKSQRDGGPSNFLTWIRVKIKNQENKKAMKINSYENRKAMKKAAKIENLENQKPWKIKGNEHKNHEKWKAVKLKKLWKF